MQHPGRNQSAHNPSAPFDILLRLDYSPAWDAQLYACTEDAINQGFRGQVHEEFQILTFVQDGLITGPGGGPFQSAGFSINCPIVQRLDWRALSSGNLLPILIAGSAGLSGHLARGCRCGGCIT